MNQFVTTLGGQEVEFDSLSDREKLFVVTEALEHVLQPEGGPKYLGDCQEVLELARVYLGRVL